MFPKGTWTFGTPITSHNFTQLHTTFHFVTAPRLYASNFTRTWYFLRTFPCYRPKKLLFLLLSFFFCVVLFGRCLVVGVTVASVVGVVLNMFIFQVVNGSGWCCRCYDCHSLSSCCCCCDRCGRWLFFVSLEVLLVVVGDSCIAASCCLCCFWMVLAWVCCLCKCVVGGALVVVDVFWKIASYERCTSF